jgi:hypothetical protein
MSHANKLNYLVWIKPVIITVFLLCMEQSYAQKTITGTVTAAENRDPVPGVNVVVKNTTVGTVTGLDGTYTIQVPDDRETLVFSFVGYLTEEIEIGNQSSINVVLVEDIEKLDEVVVIGYGNVKKRDLTGSVASIKSEDMERNIINSFEQGIQGRLAGVSITQGDAAPGEVSAFWCEEPTHSDPVQNHFML